MSSAPIAKIEVPSRTVDRQNSTCQPPAPILDDPTKAGPNLDPTAHDFLSAIRHCTQFMLRIRSASPGERPSLHEELDEVLDHLRSCEVAAADADLGIDGIDEDGVAGCGLSDYMVGLADMVIREDGCRVGGNLEVVCEEQEQSAARSCARDELHLDKETGEEKKVRL